MVMFSIHMRLFTVQSVFAFGSKVLAIFSVLYFSLAERKIKDN